MIVEQRGDAAHHKHLCALSEHDPAREQQHEELERPEAGLIDSGLGHARHVRQDASSTNHVCSTEEDSGANLLSV